MINGLNATQDFSCISVRYIDVICIILLSYRNVILSLCVGNRRLVSPAVTRRAPSHVPAPRGPGGVCRWCYFFSILLFFNVIFAWLFNWSSKIKRHIVKSINISRFNAQLVCYLCVRRFQAWCARRTIEAGTGAPFDNCEAKEENNDKSITSSFVQIFLGWLV